MPQINTKYGKVPLNYVAQLLMFLGVYLN